MFGDFLTLAADQLINHAAKFRWMYNDQVCVPLVIRTPMGGRRGYGPTHSQTLEKTMLGVPGLRVVAPCALRARQGGGAPPADAGQLLLDAIAEDDPILFVENKLLYTTPVRDQSDLAEFELSLAPGFSGSPVYQLTLRAAPPPVLTLAAYGYMAELAREAMLKLAYEREIFARLLVLTQLSPFELEPIIASASQTGRLLAVEEGTLGLGWGAEVIARAAEALGPRLKAAGRVAALDLPVPSSGPLEEAVLPGVEEIIAASCRLVRGAVVENYHLLEPGCPLP